METRLVLVLALADPCFMACGLVESSSEPAAGGTSGSAGSGAKDASGADADGGFGGGGGYCSAECPALIPNDGDPCACPGVAGQPLFFCNYHDCALYTLQYASCDESGLWQVGTLEEPVYCVDGG
jgi:hypothetical protein